MLNEGKVIGREGWGRLEPKADILDQIEELAEFRDRETVFRCIANRSEGETCNSAQPCEGPLLCADRAATTWVCARVVLRDEAGESCAGIPEGE